MKSEEITKALQWRYAVKTYNAEKKVSDADLKTILESGRLAPSSYGVEPWKFISVKNPDIRAKLRAAGYNQSQITDASDLIVITYRTDVDALPKETIERTALAQGKSTEELAGYEQMIAGSITAKGSDGNKHSWVKAQTYIALGIMLETAALLEIDATPMEGFDPAQVDEILGLRDKHLASATILAIGYRGDDAYAAAPKTRRAFDDVVVVI